MRTKRSLRFKIKMTQPKARTLAVTSVTLLMAAGALAAATNGGFAESRPLSVQIKLDIQRAIEANAAAETSLEWRASGYRPSEIFQNVRDFKSPEARNALCEGLQALRPVDLALFEDELNDEKNQALLPCAGELKERVDEHWLVSREELAIAHPDPMRLSSTGKGTEVKLPSVEVEVDAAAGPLLTRGGLKNGEIALTFDDGPHATRTSRILEILGNAGVRVVFFEIGENTRAYPEISRKVGEAGHIVASHTFTHPQLPKLTSKKAEAEIRDGREAVALASGMEIPFFRFPYGAHNSYLDQFIRSEGMASFLWNIDTTDWKIRDPKLLLKRIISELDREKGGIMLFHDIHEQTVIVLPHVLEELKARGITTVLFVPKE